MTQENEPRYFGIEDFGTWYLDNFIELYDNASEQYDKRKARYQEFLEEWPIERLKTMTIDEYIVGNGENSKGTLCYELDYGKYSGIGLGIRGGTPLSKFGLMWSKEDNAYRDQQGLILADQVEERFSKLKQDLVEILEKGLALDFADPVFNWETSSNEFTRRPAFVTKLLCIYSFPNQILVGVNFKRNRDAWDNFVPFEIQGGPYKQNYDVGMLIQQNFPELSFELQTFVDWQYVNAEFEAKSDEGKQEVEVRADSDSNEENDLLQGLSNEDKQLVMQLIERLRNK